MAPGFLTTVPTVSRRTGWGPRVTPHWPWSTPICPRMCVVGSQAPGHCSQAGHSPACTCTTASPIQWPEVKEDCPGEGAGRGQSQSAGGPGTQCLRHSSESEVKEPQDVPAAICPSPVSCGRGRQCGWGKAALPAGCEHRLGVGIPGRLAGPRLRCLQRAHRWWWCLLSDTTWSPSKVDGHLQGKLNLGAPTWSG